MHCTYCYLHLLHEAEPSRDHGRELRVWTPVKVLLCLVRLVQWELIRWMSSPPILQHSPCWRWRRIQTLTCLRSKHGVFVLVWQSYLMMRKQRCYGAACKGLISRSILALRDYAGLPPTAAYRWSCQRWSALLASCPLYAPCKRALTWPWLTRKRWSWRGSWSCARTNRRGAVLFPSIASTMGFFKRCMAMNARRCVASY